MRPPRVFVASVVVFGIGGTSSFAQCPSWTPDQGFPGVQGFIKTQCVWDDGTGSALYVGGSFTLAGDTVAYNLAKWDGTAWSAVGGGLDNTVECMIVWNDGTGPALFVGGHFQSAGGVSANRVAKWDGASFSALAGGLVGPPLGCAALCMEPFDDGTGEKLFVGGNFSGAGAGGGNIARWDGTQWLFTSFLNGLVTTLEVFDDGTGAAIYAGGTFGQPIEHLGRWNGSTWDQTDTPLDSGVSDLLTFDDGLGVELYAITGGGVQSWDGSTWTQLGAPGEITSPRALAVLDDGTTTGDALYAAANFPGSAQSLVRWTGTQWERLGSTDAATGIIHSMAAYGSALPGFGRIWVAGSFAQVEGRLVSSLARWDGAQLLPISHGLWGDAVGLTAITDTAGTRLYAAVNRLANGSSKSNHVVERDSVGWKPFGGVLFDHEISSLTTWNDNGVPELLATGRFGYVGGQQCNGIARYHLGAWRSFGPGLTDGSTYNDTTVHAAVGHDDGTGGKLFAAGDFLKHYPPTGEFMNRIARWNGTSWIPVGSGLSAPTFALCEFDGDLIAGGSFAMAGGNFATCVARWDGTSWSSIGSGLIGTVYALLASTEAGVPVLYAAGGFSLTFGGPFVNLARFDGSTWTAVGTGFDAAVHALRVFDDGSGAALFAGGAFTTASGTFAPRVARWDGSSWSSVGGGASDLVRHFTTYDGGTGAELWLGGSFTQVGGVLSRGAAAWKGCSQTGTGYCFGDGSATACPCGNAGATGNGCATSFNAAGGHLGARGMASVTQDTLVLEGSGTSSSVVTFFQGTTSANGGMGVVFGDGLRCAGGSTLRLGAIAATSGSSEYPSGSSQPISIRGQIPGGGGVTRTYQLWYRNAASFCTPSTFNLTNGVRIDWIP